MSGRQYLNSKLVISLLLMTVVVWSPLVSPLARAISPADDDIHIRDTLHVGGAGDPCQEQSRTINWSDPNWWKSTWNYLNNYDGAQNDTNAFISEFNTNLGIGSGWAVSQRPNANSGNMNMITIQTFPPNATLTVLDGGRLQVSGTVRSFDIFLNPGVGCRIQSWNSGAQNVSAYGNNIVGEYGYFLVASNNIQYPSGYEGLQIPTTDAHADFDGDGLNAAKEASQNTSNDIKDTDGDGLNDYIESEWYANREVVYCGSSQCAYPSPTHKDIYVEIDWMKNGSMEYKPNNAQLSSVEDGLSEQGYNVHIDTGQYGGGNQLANYVQYLPFSYDAGSTGFFDLKDGNVGDNIAANFNANRQGVWRYMITGYGYGEAPSSSGASYTGSGNIFISSGKIQDSQSGFGYTDLDTAIAGTIVHELGHSLCMSETQKYSYQSSACQYNGVDSYATSTYDSVLNYNLQMLQNTLSDGNNGFGDHSDWGAIDASGIADFSQWSTNEIGFTSGVDIGLTIEDAQKAMRAGTYGKLVGKDGRIYDLLRKKMYNPKDGKLYNINKNRHVTGLSK